MARRPSIAIRAKINGAHRFFAPTWNRNGTLKPGYAKRHQEPFNEFAYYVRWTENGKRKMECVGADAGTALMMARQRQSTSVPPQSPPAETATERRTIRSVAADWLIWAKQHKSAASHKAYKRTAEVFLEFCAGQQIVYLGQITEGRLLDYKLFLERHPAKFAEPTRWKLLNQLHGCLRRARCQVWLARGDMPQKDDGHRYTEYTAEQIKSMLERGCTETGDWEFIALLAMTGVRRNEIAHMERGDFDAATNEVTVRNKPQYGFRVKNRQERVIGIDPALMARFKRYADRLPPGQSLLFPAIHGGIDCHLERRTRRIAETAGVPVPKKPNHALRVAFATRLNRHGTDIETVRRLCGHCSIQITEIYQ